ncbi:MAG: flavin reductase [Acidimicrobiia bacterium]
MVGQDREKSEREVKGVDPLEFRKVMSRFATGVTVVTTRTPDGKPHGLTANAFMSVSLHPPLVLVSIDKKTDTHGYLDKARAFCVNVLKEGHREISDRFASKHPNKFEGVSHSTKHTGAPVLEDALAWIDCRVVDRFEGGDHTLFLGEVVGLEYRGGRPLLFYGGKYGKLSHENGSESGESGAS